MSTTIDQKVVEMKFDNSNFEKNVGTTISTLDKLKAALRLDKASKGLDEVNSASENNKIGKLGEAAESVGQRFSALQAIATGALMKIGSQAVTTGEQLLKSITIDQISAGYKKYEEKTQAVQTIMAGTGKTADEVNDALEKLIWFADETSYSFTDMTSNIAKFTAQGVDLEVAETAMQGISTWAAISGKNTQAAEHAMYNLAQALGTGAVKLQDWKSITNVNMDTVEFKKTVLDTAAALGELEKTVDSEGVEHYFARVGAKAKKTEVSVSDFTSTMKEGWFTSEVLLQVLGKYGEYSDGLYEVYETLSELGPEYSKTTSEIISDMKKLHGADEETILNAGYTKDLIPLIREMSNEYDGLGARAFKAAQEAITFSQAIDATKDAVSSQWMTTFEYIFGDINQAREMWTDLANDLWDVFAAGGERRNIFLNYLDKHGALDNFREGVIRSFRNILNIIELTKESFTNVFSGPSADAVVELSKRFDKLTRAIEITDNVIEKFGDESIQLTKNEEKVYRVLYNLRSAFEGLLSVLKIGTTIIKSFIKILATIADEILPTLDVSLLDVVGDFGDFLKIFSEAAINKIEEFTDQICDFIRAIKDFPLVKKAAAYVDSFVQSCKNSIDEFAKLNIDFKSEIQKLGLVLAQFFNPSDLNMSKLRIAGLETLQEYLKDFTGSDKVVSVANRIQEAFTNLYDSIKSFKMPSVKNNLFNFLKEFSVGLSAGGLLGGLKNSVNYIRTIFTTKVVKLKDSFLLQLYEIGQKIGPLMSKAFDALKSAFTSLKQFIFGSREITVETIADIGRKIAALVLLIKAINVFDNVGEVFEGIGDALSGIGKAMKLKSVAAVLKSVAWVLLSISVSLAIIGNIPADDAWRGVRILGVMSLIIGGLTYALSKLTSSFTGTITGGISDVAHLIGLALVLASLAGAILAMIKSVKEFGAMNTRELERGMLGVIGMIGALAIATMAVGRTCKGATALSTGIILAFVLGLQKILDVITEYSAFPWNENKKGLESMLGMMVVLAACVRLMSTKVGKDERAVSNIYSLLVFVISLRILLKGVEQLGLMPIEEMKQGIKGVVGLLFALTGCIVAMNLSSQSGVLKKGERSVNQFKGVATALLGLCVAIVVLGHLPMNVLEQGGLAVAACLTILGIFVRLSSVGSEVQVPKLLSIFIGAGLIIAEIAYIIKQLTPLGGNEVLKTCEGFAILLGTVAAIMLAIAFIGKIKMDKSSGKNIVKTIAAMYALLPLVGVLTILVKYLKDVDTKGAISKIAAITTMMGAISLLALAVIGLSKLKFDWPSVFAVEALMLTTAGLFVIAAGVMTSISKVNPKGAISKIGALTLLLGAMSLVLLACIGIGSIFMASENVLAIGTGAAILGLYFISGVVAIVAQILKGLNEVDGINAIANVGALSLLLGAMCLVLLACVGIGAIFAASSGILALGTGGAILGLYFISGVVAIVAKIIKGLNEVDGNNAIANVKALSLLLGVMSGVLLACSVIGILAIPAIAGVGILLTFVGLLTGFMDAVGAIAAKTSLIENINKAIEVVELLGESIGSFLGGIAEGVIDSVGSSLPEFGQRLGDFYTNAEPFFDGISKFSDSSVEGVGRLAEAIFVLTAADLLNSISDFIVIGSGLTTLGNDLSSFWEASKPFFDGIGSINGDAVNAAKNVADLIITLTEVDMLNGIKNFFSIVTGTSLFYDFGVQLSYFGTSIKQFSDSIQDVDDAKINSVLPTIERLISMSKNIENSGGLLGLITGENDWTQLGEGLAELGDAICKFGIKCEQIVRGGYEKYIGASIPIIEKLISVSSTIQNDGGLFGYIVGNNNWTELGDGLSDFGESLKRFGIKCEQIIRGGYDKYIEASIPVIRSLAKILDIIPNSGISMISVWVGDNTWRTFGDGLAEFGTALKKYGDAVTFLHTAAIEDSIPAVEALSKVANLLPNFGGIIAEIFGEGNWTNFGKGLADLGVAIKDFGNAVNVENLSSKVQNGVDAIKILSNLDTEMFDTATLTQVGMALKTFSADFNVTLSNLFNGGFDYTQLPVISTSIKELVDSLSTLGGLDSKGMSLLIQTIGELGTTAITELSNGITTNSPLVIEALQLMINKMVDLCINAKPTFLGIGIDFNVQLMAGIRFNRDAVTRTFLTVVESSVVAIRNRYSHFYSAGQYLVEGFIEGISSKVADAASQAAEMARASYEAACAELGIASPSRLMKVVGGYFAAGFSIGIRNSSDDSELSAANMAKRAADSAINVVSTLSNSVGAILGNGFVDGIDSYNSASAASGARLAISAINAVNDLIENGIDIEPKITPVLDLSKVTEGSKQLSSILSKNQAMNISASMNQNGASNGASIHQEQQSQSTTFIQNNYSPKALSRIDIYRQTENQLLSVRG